MLTSSPNCAHMKTFRAFGDSFTPKQLMSFLTGFPRVWRHLEELSLLGSRRYPLSGSYGNFKRSIEEEYDPSWLVPPTVADAKLKTFRFTLGSGNECSMMLSMVPRAALETLEVEWMSAPSLNQLCSSGLGFGPRLRELIIHICDWEQPTWMDWFSFCASSVAASLTRLVIKHQESRHEEFMGLDDKCLASFYTSSCRLSSLKELVIQRGCLNISTVIPKLVQAMPSLEILDLQHIEGAGQDAEETAAEIVDCWRARRADFKNLRLPNSAFGKEVQKFVTIMISEP